MLRSFSRAPVALVVLVLIATLAVVVLATRGGDDADHRLRLNVSAALNMAPGQDVRIAGSVVGRIDAVDRRPGGATVSIRITDDRVWPLHQSARAALRYGATTNYMGRFVQLLPEGDQGPALRDGAVLPLSKTSEPVEFDRVYSILDKRTRPRLQATLKNLSTALRGRRGELRAGLRTAGRSVTEATDLFAELSRDQVALSTLVRSGASATSAIAREDPALENLVVRSADTFDGLARQSASIQSTLERMPSTLKTTRSGLARVDDSVPGVRRLLDDVAPGARQLAVAAPVIRSAADRLIDVAPIANTSVRTLTAASPRITELLRDGGPFARETTKALRTAAPMLGCLRPYGPEIAGFFATWAGYTASVGANGHYSRALPPVQPIVNGTPLNSEQSIAANPQLRYAFPQPPGFNAGQAWLQPQCGAGSDALDPSKDPEITNPRGSQP